MTRMPDGNLNDGRVRRFGLSAFWLRIIAMVLMLLDHATVICPNGEIYTAVGRLAFPIFAFLLAEGFAHTHDVRRYMGRMFCWALVSEIPFNYMCGGGPLYPWHQNVLWTFLIALAVLALTKKTIDPEKPVRAVILTGAVLVAGYILGYLAMVDYYGVGVLTVLMFYATRKPGISNKIIQVLFMWAVNVQMLGGYCYAFTLFGRAVEFPQQGLALLALPLIWLYNGRRGHDSWYFRMGCYAFYPVHIIALLMFNAISNHYLP